MTSNPFLLAGTVWLIVGVGLPFSTFGQNAPKITPAPDDPLELVTGQIPVAATSANREAILQLLAHARNSFTTHSAGQAYDLKVSFTADSGSQTTYDGAWEMEDLYVPGQGLRWTAKAAAGFTITGISSAGRVYANGTAGDIPLRLHEARGLLFDPIQSPAYASRGSIRTATATFRGATVTCVLLSRSQNAANPATGRGWEETEECIDAQSGLLEVHSEVPGRYAVYEYANAPQLGGRVLPRSVTVTEAGKIVSKISVQSLEELTAPDQSLFVPTDTMKASGRATVVTSAAKISRVHGEGPFTSAMTVRPVCVFGVVNASGQLVEAHSLQPSDPNSQAAVADAKGIDFASAIPVGAAPQQHFVFVIEKFVSR